MKETSKTHTPPAYTSQSIFNPSVIYYVSNFRGYSLQLELLD